MMGRHGRHFNPTGMETPPKPLIQYHNLNQDERSATPTVDEKEITYNQIPSTDHVRIVSLVHPSQQHQGQGQPQQSQQQLQQPPPPLPPHHHLHVRFCLFIAFYVFLYFFLVHNFI